MAGNEKMVNMGIGTHRIRVITASVRTTHRINTLLNESMTVTENGKKKTILKNRKESLEEEESDEIQIRTEIYYIRTHLCMDHICKLIEKIIDERMHWDRFNRMYDPWRSVKFAESLASEIKERIKDFKYIRYRIVCFLSIIEKQHQGIDYKMQFLMDSKMDNYSNFIYEKATYYIIASVFLVYKE